MLLALLRTPKTRAGLIAAAASSGVTKNFVYGFLSQQQREGVVTMLRSTNPVQYQATDAIVVEKPSEGLGFPSWLEPRVLPQACGRHTYIDGRSVYN
jgi:hypothetical protein